MDPPRVRVQFSNFPDCHSPLRGRSPGIFPRFTGTGKSVRGAMILFFLFQHLAWLFKIPAGVPSSVLKITLVRLVCRDRSCQSTVILPQRAIFPHSLSLLCPPPTSPTPSFIQPPSALSLFVSSSRLSFDPAYQNPVAAGCPDTNITIYLQSPAHFKSFPIPRFKDLRDT